MACRAGQGRHREKFQRILDAALGVFAERGFDAAKVSDIARAAGVADGTIYLYFKDKSDLMVSLMDSKQDALAAALRHAVAALAPGCAQLLQIIDHHTHLATTQPQLMAFMRRQVHESAMPGGARRKAKRDAYLQEWARIIEAGQASGDFSKHVDSDLVVQLVFGALDHACAIWAGETTHDPARLAQITDMMRQFALQAVSAAR